MQLECVYDAFSLFVKATTEKKCGPRNVSFNKNNNKSKALKGTPPSTPPITQISWDDKITLETPSWLESIDIPMEPNTTATTMPQQE